MLKFNKIISIFTITFFASVAIASAEVAVIGNVSTSSLDAKQVKSIFLGKTDKLPDGSAVEVIDIKEGSAVRDEFYGKVVGKNTSRIKAYWGKRIFTGKGTPPDTVAFEADVKAWVAGASGRIGYVSAGALDGSEKVLLRMP